MEESNKLLVEKERKKLLLIQIAIIIAAIVLLVILAINHYLTFRYMTYCKSVEQHADIIIAAVSCYMTEPGNKSCTEINSVLNDSTCGYITYSLQRESLTQTGSGENAWWSVSVTDMSSRCPRGNCYTAYIGTDSPGIWK